MNRRERGLLQTGIMVGFVALLGLAMAVTALVSGVRQVGATPADVEYDTVAVGTLESVKRQAGAKGTSTYVIRLNEYEEPFIAQANYRLYGDKVPTDAPIGAKMEIMCNYQKLFDRYICRVIIVDGEVYASPEDRAAYMNSNGKMALVMCAVFLVCGILLGIFAGVSLRVYFAKRGRRRSRQKM